MATGVVRDLDNETLAGILNKNAFSLAVDGWTFLDKKKDWVVGGWVGGTRVEGSVEDILRLQNSSMHYFQRPDATHVEVDPTATSPQRLGGRGSTWPSRTAISSCLANIGALSPGFDPNDTGFQYGGSDVINMSVPPRLPVDEAGQGLPVRARHRRLVPELRLRRQQDLGRRARPVPGPAQEFLAVQHDVRLQPGHDQQDPDPGRAAGPHAVGLPVRLERGDGQPQAGRVRVRRDDLPAGRGRRRSGAASSRCAGSRGRTSACRSGRRSASSGTTSSG